MFVGAVPMEVVQQMLATVRFDDWKHVFVGCSGSFRVDRAIKMRYPDVKIYSNDVSLLTCSIGALAMKREFPITFKGKLEFVEEFVHDLTFEHRVAAVMVCCALGQYTSKNRFATAHFEHYRRNFAIYAADAMPKLRKLVDEIKIEEFYAGDFLEQVTRAEAAGGGFACFAPTYKGGYERLYRLLNDNTEWTPPQYGMWDPKKLPELLDDLDARGIPYSVFSDQRIDGREPTTEFRGSNKPVWTYSRERTASVRRRSLRGEPFKYTPVDAEKVQAGSRCEVRQCDAAYITFLKNVYLAKGIHHVIGNANFLVYVDDMLVGGFTYSLTKFGDPTSELYLLSDFSISREARLSKLVAMMSTCRDVVRVMNRRMVIDVKTIHTTAFTRKPVSMKYRGIFELTKRAEDHLQYASEVRPLSVQEVFNEWFARFGGKEPARKEPRGKGDRRGDGRPANADRSAQAA